MNSDSTARCAGFELKGCRPESQRLRVCLSHSPDEAQKRPMFHREYSASQAVSRLPFASASSAQLAPVRNHWTCLYPDPQHWPPSRVLVAYPALSRDLSSARTHWRKRQECSPLLRLTINVLHILQSLELSSATPSSVMP